jgi:hypothetical protein
VIQVGFAGLRLLVEGDFADPTAKSAVEQLVRQRISEELRSLAEFAGARYFLCGISQIAIGADTLFAQACQELGVVQRVFLPQHRQDYISAVGSNGQPDFSYSEKRQAEELLSNPLVVEERVIGDAADRSARFEAVNREILRASDVMLLVLPNEARSGPGGAGHLLEQAKRLGKPTIELRIVYRDSKPTIEKTWHHADKFVAPKLPPALMKIAEDGIVDIEGYCDSLKEFASGQANSLRRLFRVFVFAIVGTHVLATVMATLALIGHSGGGPVSGAVVVLLSIELGFLIAGLSLHMYLHNSEAVKDWALSRLLAEISRSMRTISALHFYPDYLFVLQFPEPLKPMLSTLSVLHLRSTRNRLARSWQEQRDLYLNRRLRDPATGQLAYYSAAYRRANLWHKWVPRLFLCSSLLAILATMVKLLLWATNTVQAPGQNFPWMEFLGGLAIVMPVIAVGFLSVAASQDIEARVHIYGEMLAFLKRQTQQLEQAISEQDFLNALIETETRLLGETASWLMRRSFMSVT